MAEKLDFIICGAQKCGTTSLDAELRQHPSLCFPDKKELHFFDNDELFARDPTPWGHLSNVFSHCSEGQLRGESTPIYMYWTPSMGRIRLHNPDIRLIVMLRDPIARCFSQWQMERGRGAEPLQFGEAVTAELESIREQRPSQHRVRSYVARGFYADQLRRIYQMFSKDQVHVIKSEEHWREPQQSHHAVFRFLGLEKPATVQAVHQNQGLGGAMIDPKLKSQLKEVFLDDVRALEQILGWDCSDWL